MDINKLDLSKECTFNLVQNFQAYNVMSCILNNTIS